MIYLLEDDNSIRDIVIYSLRAQGMECMGFSLSSEFWSAMSRKTPSLVLLDIMLPEEDGLSILKRLKTNVLTADIKVIMLTAKGTEFDKVTGLDLGADGYISKPFGIMELTARIRAMLRREPAYCGSLSFGGIQLSVEGHSVSVDNHPVSLTSREFELLRMLMSEPEKVFTRNDILISIWGSSFEGETRTVDMHIKSLRQKLMQKGALIKTVRGLGYKLEMGNS